MLAKKFSCCVSYCLVEVGGHGVQISIFIYQRSKKCKSTIASWKALTIVGSFSFSRSNLILGWVGFLEFLRRVWKVITMSWSLPTSAPGNVLVLAGLPLPALLAKKFSCCVSYCLVEVGGHGVQISIFIYQRSKKCKSTIASWKALTIVGSFSFSRSNLILGWVGFLEFLRRVWKVITMSWSLPTSAPGNVLVLAVYEPFLHQHVVNLVMMCSIWAVPCPTSGWLLVA